MKYALFSTALKHWHFHLSILITKHFIEYNFLKCNNSTLDWQISCFGISNIWENFR